MFNEQYDRLVETRHVHEQAMLSTSKAAITHRWLMLVEVVHLFSSLEEDSSKLKKVFQRATQQQINHRFGGFWLFEYSSKTNIKKIPVTGL